jgi:hypothetical protein
MLNIERSEVYNSRETVISKGQIPWGVIASFHYFGASPIQFTILGQTPYRKTCMSMYNIFFRSVMFLYYE